jgi:hypothetical protein
LNTQLIWKPDPTVVKKIPTWASTPHHIESIFYFFNEAENKNLIKQKIAGKENVAKAIEHLNWLEKKYPPKKPTVVKVQ